MRNPLKLVLCQNWHIAPNIFQLTHLTHPPHMICLYHNLQISQSSFNNHICLLQYFTLDSARNSCVTYPYTHLYPRILAHTHINNYHHALADMYLLKPNQYVVLNVHLCILALPQMNPNISTHSVILFYTNATLHLMSSDTPLCTSRIRISVDI